MASIVRAFRVFGYLTAALAAAVLLLLLVNQIDEDLKPEVRAYFESGRTPELTESSGFAMVVGLSAPVDQDPRKFAVEWSRAVATAAQERKPYPDTRDALKVRAAPEIICYPDQFDCAERFKGKPQSILDLVADHSVLLSRYRELQQQTNLGDAGILAVHDVPLPFYGTALSVQGVFLSQVAVMVAGGDFDGALRALEVDAAFYRRWLSEGRLIISKMIALRGLARDLLLAMQISRRMNEPTPAQREALRRIAAPLSPAEWALGNTIRFEAAGLADAVDRAKTGRKERQKMIAQENPYVAQLLGLALLRNATLNFAYPSFTLWERLDSVESKDLGEQVGKVKNELRWMQEPQWNWLYNLGGKGIVAKSLDYDPGSYNFRIRDIDALAKLACAMFDIREYKVASEAVEAHLAQSASACRDPYTGKPFRWDAATKRLWFEPKGSGSGERLGGTKERVGVSPY
jgi:hypothetical protein